MSTQDPEGDRDRRALTMLLRWRPVTTAEAAELLGLAMVETGACLSRLAAQGYVVWDGDVLGYQSPELRTIAEVGARLAGVRRGLTEMEELLQELPVLVESWSTRSRMDDPHVIEVLRGPVPMAEVWTRHLSWHPPERVSLFMPEILSAEDTGQDLDAAEAYLRETGVDLRCVVGADNVPSPDPEISFAGIAPSARVRVHPRVPSWMMVSDRVVVLPMQWGRADLVDLVLIGHRPSARAMTDFFDVVWEQSVPVPGRGGPVGQTQGATQWDGLLALLERGATVEVAGRALGLSPRTAQRRIGAAMAHYGVNSQFALATAWARDTAARQTSCPSTR